MDRKKKETYTAQARVVQITDVKNDLSGGSSNHAFVEFIDHQGQPAKGSFPIAESPLFTTIRVGSIVEIQYSPGQLLGGYGVSLLDPENYKRVPTEEELAPYRRNKKRVLLQSLMAIPVLFAALILYGVSRNFLLFVLPMLLLYPIMKFGGKQEIADSGKRLSFYPKKEEETKENPESPISENKP